jgi:hypothetical protein
MGARTAALTDAHTTLTCPRRPWRMTAAVPLPPWRRHTRALPDHLIRLEAEGRWHGEPESRLFRCIGHEPSRLGNASVADGLALCRGGGVSRGGIEHRRPGPPSVRNSAFVCPHSSTPPRVRQRDRWIPSNRPAPARQYARPRPDVGYRPRRRALCRGVAQGQFGWRGSDRQRSRLCQKQGSPERTHERNVDTSPIGQYTKRVYSSDLS